MYQVHNRHMIYDPRMLTPSRLAGNVEAEYVQVVTIVEGVRHRAEILS